MKTMKRFLAGMVAVASVMAIAPMSAFATDDTKIEQDSTNKTGGMVVRYLKSAVSPTYTITIPATVDLNAETPTATIKAEDVYLDITKHKQINVTLDSAQYVETGASEFIAKTTDGNSQVTYTIGKGTATTGVKVGDTVAEFTADGSQVLSFSAPTGATYAGAHTETLTFGISVENAIQSETISLIGNDESMAKFVTSEHFKVTAGYGEINGLGLTVNSFGAMTIESLNGENITKIELSYAWGANAHTVSVTPGTLNNAYNISDINDTKVTVSSSSNAGVRLDSVKIYYN